MLEDLIKDREKKLERYRASADPYPAKIARGSLIADVLKSFVKLERSKEEVSVPAGYFLGVTKAK